MERQKGSWVPSANCILLGHVSLFPNCNTVLLMLALDLSLCGRVCNYIRVCKRAKEKILGEQRPMGDQWEIRLSVAHWASYSIKQRFNVLHRTKWLGTSEIEKWPGKICVYV